MTDLTVQDTETGAKITLDTHLTHFSHVGSGLKPTVQKKNAFNLRKVSEEYHLSLQED